MYIFINIQDVTKMKTTFLLLIMAAVLVNSKEIANNTRASKAFSLFTIVQFPNSACTTTSSSFTQGTCLSSSECTESGGSALGNCAAGFGVCCVVSVSTCGSTLSKNCTYITNPGFPAGYTTTGTCTYTVNKLDSTICQLRLDFATMDTVVSTADATAGQCGGTTTIITDSLAVAGQTGRNPPEICGINTGLHMYVDFGKGDTDTVSVPFALTATTGATRKWNVKTTQIECTSTTRCDGSCTQCFTGVSGNVQSYGFGTAQLLQSQQYANCVRREAGYCSIVWTQSTTTSPDPFGMTNAAIAGNAVNAVDSCIASYVVAPSGYLTTGLTGIQMCGESFGPDVTATAGPYTSSLLPFQLDVLTTAVAMVGQAGSGVTGFSLDYNQQPC